MGYPARPVTFLGNGINSLFICPFTSIALLMVSLFSLLHVNNLPRTTRKAQRRRVSQKQGQLVESFYIPSLQHVKDESSAPVETLPFMLFQEDGLMV